MPIIKTEDAPLDIGTAEGLHAELGPYGARRLSDAGGLTQFGVLLETLPPGSRSSHKHWHEQEDEFIYMLSGTATLLEGEAVNELHPGDAATFKAGTPLGHCLENRSSENCVYLVVGSRSPNETVHYSDKDMILTKVNFVKSLTDRAGKPLTD
ncbi:cupin domain-containing protein [Allorhizobium taibaishanense]|uniref:Cupin n=1 Tax=Allorhizobium taibaishanense TaxID=887144 RepID=A0A1Q9AAD3_9HYPH|nr:cupin domain-containing protein [Allorhizobium taibaishanense]MBB4007022.1 putative cupin superfamily protein [Allorhizobium taibaishanense]OLP51834.1 cupin [Allorhizobium taibaishanense]